MATVDKWRTRLNEQSFCKKLRENNAKESKNKIYTDAKGLVAVIDNDLFVWDSHASHIIYYNLKNFFTESGRQNRSQVLQCTDTPSYQVEWLVWNQAQTHLAMWGQLGITVLELPQKWGKYAEYEGGKDVVSCKCTSIAGHYFSSHRGVRLLQVLWHPGSETDSHVTFLTSDNLLSTYDLLEPDKPSQTVQLGDREPSFGMSLTRASISTALGDNVVSFDFGTAQEVYSKHSGQGGRHRDKITVWPTYCVRGNGDVVVAYTDTCSRPVRLPVLGPLLMHPPAEDNYGNDACALVCLPTTPPVVVIATCEGRLHHCLLLPRGLEDTTIQSLSSCRSVGEDSTWYSPPEEVLLYVYETVELELSLTTPTFGDAPMPDDVFTCPIRLIKDNASPDRYHCSHAAGVHTVALPWIYNYQQFCCDDGDDGSLPEHQESIVEHLICTKPLATSPPSPILGLAVVRDVAVGSTLLTLSSDYDFHCLRLSDTRAATNLPTLLSSSRSQSIPSPIRRLSREPFEDRIRKILQRNTSNPLLKSRQTQLRQQECFQLLSRATQVFREEYIQKQDLAHQEISRRVGILKEQKLQQQSDLAQLQGSRETLGGNAERIAIDCEDCKEKQEELLKRIEAILRKLQSRIPFLSESERSMKRELENMDDRLDSYNRSLEQLKVKRDYQQRQIQQSKKSCHPSPVIKKAQMQQLRDVLKHESDEIADLMKKVTNLKMDNTA